ncbi:MAG: hypothetical protein F6J87_13970 [Spirulina sp. SIO3F2]|nr:hypothetical protein [Spirulina sp. SIO3F2]
MFAIDDYEAALELKAKLEAATPFNVRLTKDCCELLKKQGQTLSPDQWYAVDTVAYLGDEGGILVGIQSDPEDEAVNVVSLTHVRIDPEHELAQAVTEYQLQRVRRLKLQNQKGFGSELLSQVKKTKKKKRKKGFG